MRVRTLLISDRRGASEVVGIILVVVITVIIASTVGAFVLGMGDRTTETVPQAFFSYDFDDETNVTITHEGGEAIDTETIRVTVDDTPGFPAPESPIDTADGWNETIENGDSLELYNATENE